MRYLFFLFAYHYARKIEGMIMNKVTHFSHSLSLMILMFSGEFLGGLATVIYQNLHFSQRQKLKIKEKEKKSKINNKNNIGIKLIQGISSINTKYNKYKISLLIFFASFFDYSEFIISCMIPDIAVLSPTSDLRLSFIITISSFLICTFALKIKTGRHHHFSIIGMGICSFIIFIIELLYKSKGTNYSNFLIAYILAICELSFVSFTDVTEKYLVDYNNMNKFKILSVEGFFGIILCIIYSFIMNENPFDEVNKVYKELDIGKKILLIIFLILYFVLSAAINIYKIICNIIYTPMVKSLPGYFLNPIFIIYSFIYQNDFISQGERNYFYFIINLILSIIINIFAFIFSEFFILHCFGLQKDTHYGIAERSVKNIHLEMEEIDEETSFFE